MLKKIFQIVKKIILAAFILYGYNLIAAPLNFMIPINIYTVLLIAFLGFPMLIGMVIFMILLL